MARKREIEREREEKEDGEKPKRPESSTCAALAHGQAGEESKGESRSISHTRSCSISRRKGGSMGCTHRMVNPVMFLRSAGGIGPVSPLPYKYLHIEAKRT